MINWLFFIFYVIHYESHQYKILINNFFSKCNFVGCWQKKDEGLNIEDVMSPVLGFILHILSCSNTGTVGSTNTSTHCTATALNRTTESHLHLKLKLNKDLQQGQNVLYLRNIVFFQVLKLTHWIYWLELLSLPTTVSQLLSYIWVNIDLEKV